MVTLPLVHISLEQSAVEQLKLKPQFLSSRKDLSLPQMFSALKYYSKQSTVLPFM